MEWLLALYAKVDWEFAAWLLAGYAMLSEYIGMSKYFKNSSVIQYLIDPVKKFLESGHSFIKTYLLPK
mgnify:CR=1 FL=1